MSSENNAVPGAYSGVAHRRGRAVAVDADLGLAGPVPVADDQPIRDQAEDEHLVARVERVVAVGVQREDGIAGVGRD